MPGNQSSSSNLRAFSGPVQNLPKLPDSTVLMVPALLTTKAWKLWGWCHWCLSTNTLSIYNMVVLILYNANIPWAFIGIEMHQIVRYCADGIMYINHYSVNYWSISLRTIIASKYVNMQAAPINIIYTRFTVIDNFVRLVKHQYPKRAAFHPFIPRNVCASKSRSNFTTH